MGKPVMIVDDSSTVRQQVGIVLRAAGYDVVEAVDGLDALQKVETAAELAMVICDVNMPRLDGIGFLSALKKDGKHPALPVVMLTTEGTPTLISRAREAGAKGWIVKPFKSEMLLATVKKLAGEP